MSVMSLSRDLPSCYTCDRTSDYPQAFDRAHDDLRKKMVFERTTMLVMPVITPRFAITPTTAGGGKEIVLLTSMITPVITL